MLYKVHPKIFILSISYFVLCVSLIHPLSATETTNYVLISPHHNQLETITVTATRDAARLGDTAASIGILGQQTIKDINAPHSSDLLNRIPGVFINQLGSTGQGTSAAIRQPITTTPVYLYLENGVPTRSPAFFNHNALYEVNVAQANSIEVIKGPGSALYGSDAIGGVINVVTNDPITDERLQLSLEAGADKWRRVQFNGARLGEINRFAAQADAIKSTGWRENNEFDRQSLNLLWQGELAGFDVNTIYSYTALDMHTGGTGLNEFDYRNNPEKAGNLIGYRDVSAQRLSSAWHTPVMNGDLTLTPYLRSNRLEYLATWTLNTGREVNGRLDSQDAHVNDNGDDSYGIQVKYKKNIQKLTKAFWIAGVDLDYGRASTKQHYIVRTDNDLGRYWLAYQAQESIYDYQVNFVSASPYFHIESDLSRDWRVNFGLRCDDIRYDYDNHLTTVNNSNVHNRPADTSIALDHLSPKLGLIYDVNQTINAFASYRHGFRIPSESQLFRAGGTVDSTNLDAVKVDSLEVGLRGQLQAQTNFEVSLYEMRKTDDILTEVNQVTGARSNANLGETDHRGIEAGLNVDLSKTLGLHIAYARNEHRFDQWRENNQDLSNKFMPAAPRSFTNVRLHYAPHWLNGGRFESEWTRQGQQFVNAANTYSYAGYQLLNLRVSYYLNQQLEIYANLLNAEDKLYAESVNSFGPNLSYTPGKPRTLFAGIKMNF